MTPWRVERRVTSLVSSDRTQEMKSGEKNQQASLSLSISSKVAIIGPRDEFFTDDLQSTLRFAFV